MKDLSRDELIALVGGERALAYVFEQNHLLSAMLAGTERELAYERQQRTEERQRFEKLSAKQSTEFQRLSDRFQRQASEYSAEFERLNADRAELADQAKANKADAEHWRMEATELRKRIDMGGPVQAMANDAIAKAVDAYHSRLGKSKVGMIVELCNETGLGSVEAKNICLQIIAAIEAAKEATD